MVTLNRIKKPIRRISLVPMINVIFMLVFFFLVGGQLQTVQILDVDLPQAKSGTLLDEGPVEVLLGKYDEIIINDVLFNDETAQAEIARQLEVNHERIITIKADQHSSANRLISFMEMARKAGGKNLSLVTEQGLDDA